jgi:hypothetical protein
VKGAEHTRWGRGETRKGRDATRAKGPRWIWEFCSRPLASSLTTGDGKWENFFLLF